MILLGKNPGMVQKNANVQLNKETEQEEFILACALKKASIPPSNIAEVKDISDDISEISSETSSQTSSSTLTTNIHEDDGLIYIAGYLARKLRKEFPELGVYTYENESKTMHSYAMPSCVQSLSFGGLTEPSISWQKDVERLNKWFTKIHKGNFKLKKNIVKKTTHMISKKEPLIAKQIINAFVRQRVFVRIKYINVNQNETLISSKKRKCDTDLERKSSKKMKKTIT